MFDGGEQSRDGYETSSRLVGPIDIELLALRDPANRECGLDP